MASGARTHPLTKVQPATYLASNRKWETRLVVMVACIV